VLGVLDKKGFNSWGQDQDDTIMVPYTTVQKKFQGGVLYVQSGIVGALSARATYAAQEQITALLRQRHRLGPLQDDDFTVRNLSEIAETAEATNRIMSTLLASIAAFPSRRRHWNHDYHAGRCFQSVPGRSGFEWR
jgi:putative ABC transport system permease protein